jgi:hypothetical protein
MELKLTLAMFIWTFDAKLEQDIEPTYFESFVAMRGPLKIRVAKRGNS